MEQGILMARFHSPDPEIRRRPTGMFAITLPASKSPRKILLAAKYSSKNEPISNAWVGLGVLSTEW